MIKKCTCAHEYQDQRYGTGNRVMNECGEEGREWRCTVCNTTCSKAEATKPVKENKK